MGKSSLDYTGGPNDVITRILLRGTQEVSRVRVREKVFDDGSRDPVGVL